jgi:PEP-CTERM motif
MRRLTPFAVMACLLAASPVAFGQAIIFDNKSTVTNPNAFGIVTDPGAGFGGADASVLQNTVPPGTTPDVNFGFGHQGAVRLAENFTVPAGFQWTINSAVTLGYLTGSTVPSATAGTLRFFNGAPNAGGTVIAGDATTNVLVPGSNTFLNIFRTLTTDIATANTRHIQTMTLTLATPLVLQPGTYWLDYNSTGTAFVPPLQVVPRTGGVVTGDALQSVDSGATWANVLDGTVQKGIPFQLLGTVSPIPEPTSLALVGLGLAGFGWRRLRKK